MFEIIFKWKDTLNVKLKPPVGGSKSLLISESLPLTESFKRLIHSGTKHIFMFLRDAKQCCGCLELFFCEMEQKHAIWCLKRKPLNINLLFIELLYKINITFVIMLIFEEKNGPLHVI